MLQQLAPDVWTHDHDFSAFGLNLLGRMTVVRLPSGALWLHSPIPIDDALAAELAALGEVRFLIAPNLFHHVHLDGALERYPEARLHGPPGFRKKRPDLERLEVLDENPPPEWEGAFAQVILHAQPKFEEVILHHRASRTLITTDLFMNAHEVRGALTRFMFWAEGCYKRPRVPRLINFLTKDRERMRADAERIASFEVERVVLAHGDNVTEDAGAFVRAELARAFGAAPATADASA